MSRPLLVLLAGCVVFAQPALAAWGHDGAPWWLPFALWGALVAGAAFAARDPPEGGA